MRLKPTSYYLDNNIWPSRDGKEHFIPDMNTQHLLNCYLKSWREGWRISMQPLLLAELRNRGLDKTHPEYFI